MNGKVPSKELNETLLNILDQLASNSSLLLLDHPDDIQCMRFLLGAGADRDTQNRYGKTLSYYLDEKLRDILNKLAMKRDELDNLDRIQYIMLLLGTGANPNVQNQAGKTLLHYVAERNDIEGIRYFLGVIKANPSIRDQSGKTPFEYVTEHNCLQAIKDLGYDLDDSHENEGNPTTPNGSVDDCSNSSGDDSQIESVKLSDCNTEEDSDYHSDGSCENEENPAKSPNNDNRTPTDQQTSSERPVVSDRDSEDSSDYYSEDEDSSCSSSDYLFLEDSLLAKLEIPLTTSEEGLIDKFCKRIRGITAQNKQESEESILESIKKIVNEYLEKGLRLNSSCSNGNEKGDKETVTNLILEEIGDVLDGRVKPRDETREYRGGVNDITNQDDEDKDEALEIIGRIIRNLLLKGGKAKEEFFYNDTELANNCGFDCANLSKECVEIKNKLISIAYEGIVNKNEQAQKGEPEEVDIDNIYFYIKYPQDSIIEPAKILNHEKAKELKLKVGILQIGESIVRVEGTKDGKRNYTDVLKSSIEMSFTTEVGEINIYLSPSKEGGNKIEVEIDEENKARLNKLKAEKKSLGENCLLGGKSVLEAIEDKGFKKNGNVPTESTETTKDVPRTDFTQAYSQQIDTSVKGR